MIDWRIPTGKRLIYDTCEICGEPYKIKGSILLGHYKCYNIKRVI
jgi:hypothetical protein